MELDANNALARAFGTSTVEETISAVLPEMRRLAARALQYERNSHTLQATELVNEVLLRFLKSNVGEFQNKGHFYSVASRMMRGILVDYARRQVAAKRGGGWEKVDLDEVVENVPVDPDLTALAVDEALSALQGIDSRAAKVVEMRYFGGFTDHEIAELLGISIQTARRDWDFARAWLRRQMDKRNVAANF